MKKYLFFLLSAIVLLFTQCNSLRNIPTNTTGGLFSLNGNWKLETTTDNGALIGTVVQVFPGVKDATIRTLGNNNYCLRDRDMMWRDLKASENGTFTLDLLVNACNNANVYQPALLTVVTNDEVRIGSRTASSTDLVQTWRRVANQ